MLELYQAEECPHSTEAREALSEHGVSYVAHNPRSVDGEERNEQTHRELVELGGEDQIPFLVDTDRETTLFDSEDIVEYVEEHYG